MHWREGTPRSERLPDVSVATCLRGACMHCFTAPHDAGDWATLAHVLGSSQCLVRGLWLAHGPCPVACGGPSVAGCCDVAPKRGGRTLDASVSVAFFLLHLVMRPKGEGVSPTQPPSGVFDPHPPFCNAPPASHALVSRHPWPCVTVTLPVVVSTSRPGVFVMTACRALIRPSGEDAMGRSCILDSPPRQVDARGSADCLLVIADGLRAKGQ